MAEFFGETPDTKQTGTERLLMPKIERRTRPQFTMMVHPQKWEWDDVAGEWLPRIAKFRHDPGANGVGVTQDGKHVQLGAGKTMMNDRGWLLIENMSPRLVPVLPQGKYLRNFDAQGGKAWAWVWELPESQDGGVEWEVDAELERKVRRFLKTEILNGEPGEKWKRKQIRQLEREVQQTAKRTKDLPNLPGIADQLKIKQARLEAIRADVERGGPVPPSDPAEAKAGKRAGAKAAA